MRSRPPICWFALRISDRGKNQFRHVVRLTKKFVFVRHPTKKNKTIRLDREQMEPWGYQYSHSANNMFLSAENCLNSYQSIQGQIELQSDPDPHLDQFGLTDLYDIEDLERAFHEHSAAALRAGDRAAFVEMTKDFQVLMLRIN